MRERRERNETGKKINVKGSSGEPRAGSENDKIWPDFFHRQHGRSYSVSTYLPIVCYSTLIIAYVLVPDGRIPFLLHPRAYSWEFVLLTCLFLKRALISPNFNSAIALSLPLMVVPEEGSCSIPDLYIGGPTSTRVIGQFSHKKSTTEFQTVIRNDVSPLHQCILYQPKTHGSFYHDQH